MLQKKKELLLIPLLEDYIKQIKKGKHLQSNGKTIKTGSVENYNYLLKLLLQFSAKTQFELRIADPGNNKSSFDREKKYWKKFYNQFTNYLYDDLDHFDNYVGSNLKLLKAFFNYLQNEKGLKTGNFHKKFYCTHEETEIIVLSPERLNFLICSPRLNSNLNPTLLKVKDIFIFGATVGLRYSDLMALTKANLEHTSQCTYLKVKSKKTQTHTSVKLPQYALDIINKYQNLNKYRLLPYFNKVLLNKRLKELMEHAGFTEPISKTRNKRGIAYVVYKNKKLKKQYRFCDLVTTHTMRRTAITTMLSLGMKEQMVRKISGHAPGSKEFYRYVSFAQNYLDNEIDLVHKKLSLTTDS